MDGGTNGQNYDPQYCASIAALRGKKNRKIMWRCLMYILVQCTYDSDDVSGLPRRRSCDYGRTTNLHQRCQLPRKPSSQRSITLRVFVLGTGNYLLYVPSLLMIQLHHCSVWTSLMEIWWCELLVCVHVCLWHICRWLRLSTETVWSCVCLIVPLTRYFWQAFDLRGSLVVHSSRLFFAHNWPAAWKLKEINVTAI